MLHEGIVTNDSGALVRTEMIRQLRNLRETTPEQWEAATFQALTGSTRDEIDWDVADNKAGYFLWIKGFNALIDELVDDGYAVVETVDGTDERRIVLGEVADDGIEYSQLTYPPQSN